MLSKILIRASTFRTAAAFGLIVGTLAVAAGPASAQSGDEIFTVAKYPVDATGTNAVAAKRKATEQGRKAAFRSLLKRLVPNAAYSQIEHLKKLDPDPYIGSIRVRSEENSSTQYIATLDFSFDPQAVRTLLRQHGVRFVDQAAPSTGLVLVYSVPKTGGTKDMSGSAGSAAWRSVWAELDLANSLAPLKILRAPGNLSVESMRALLAAEPSAVGALAAQYQTGQVIVAEAKPIPASNELHITLAGQDGAGRFSVTKQYRLDEDFVYSLELAAVIGQGVIESRWKTQMTASSGTGAASNDAIAPFQVLAEFSNLGQWQRQQQVLSSTPGVRDMQVGSLSGRSANIALSFPGGGEALRDALVPRGLTLENINGFWILR